jgi:predicted ATPase
MTNPRPLLIELAGSPAGGKDSIVNELKNSTAVGRVEVIGEIVRRAPISNSDFDLRLLWTVYSTLAEARRVENLMRQTVPIDLIIFNRGLFDCIAWLRVLGRRDGYARRARDLEQLLWQDVVLTSMNLVVTVVTSYPRAVLRKTEGPGRIINHEFMMELNEVYITLCEDARNRIPLLLIDERYDTVPLDHKGDLIAGELLKGLDL